MGLKDKLIQQTVRKSRNCSYDNSTAPTTNNTHRNARDYLLVEYRMSNEKTPFLKKGTNQYQVF